MFSIGPNHLEPWLVYSNEIDKLQLRYRSLISLLLDIYLRSLFSSTVMLFRRKVFGCGCSCSRREQETGASADRLFPNGGLGD